MSVWALHMTLWPVLAWPVNTFMLAQREYWVLVHEGRLHTCLFPGSCDSLWGAEPKGLQVTSVRGFKRQPQSQRPRKASVRFGLTQWSESQGALEQRPASSWLSQDCKVLGFPPGSEGGKTFHLS